MLFNSFLFVSFLKTQGDQGLACSDLGGNSHSFGVTVEKALREDAHGIFEGPGYPKKTTTVSTNCDMMFYIYVVI